MEAKLIHEGEQPYFLINGKEYPPQAFMTYAPDADRFSEMRDVGTKLFSFTIFIGDNGINDYTGTKPFSENFYKGYHQYDFTAVDRMLEQVAPEGAEVFVFPRIYLDAPGWWLEDNPNERCQNQAGQRFRQSFASEKWREDMWTAVQALINHIRSTRWKEHLIGFHVAFGGTEECVYQTTCNDESVDMSPVNFRRYQKWLQQNEKPMYERFPTPFERRYGMNGVLRDSQKEAHTIHYYQYHSFLIADTICYFCEKIKTYTGNGLLTGAFYGYIFSNYDNNKGHNAIDTLLHCPYIDFVSSTNGPNMENQSWPFSVPVDSFRLHKKLWFAEGDIRTYKFTGLSKYLSHAAPATDYYEKWPHPDTSEMSVSMMRKASARTLCGHSGLWWFDLFGDWFRAPELMKVISDHHRFAEQQSDGPLKAEVAVFVDEVGMLRYSGSRPEVLSQVIAAQREQLMWTGFPYHTYILQDIADPAFRPEDYKLFILLAAVSPSQKIREAIEKRVKGGGRTLLWVHLADMESGDETMTDFHVTYNYLDLPMRAEAVLRNANRWHEHVVFPGVPVSCGRFSSEDMENSYQAATFKDSEEPSMLIKVFSGAASDGSEAYTSIYSLLPGIHHRLLRELASESGVHIYNHDDDCIYAGGSFMGLCSKSEGVKHLYLPEGISHVENADTGEEIEIRNQYIDFAVQAHETKIFRVFR